MSTLSERLSAAIEERGINQADLARACGVAPPSVNDWLSGKTKTMKAATALRAASALGVSLLWLTEGRGQKHPGKQTAAEPLEDYKVTPIQTERERRVEELKHLMSQMNDFGIVALLEKAKELQRTYPTKSQANAG